MSGTSRGKVKNLIIAGFLKKVCPQHLFPFFSSNSPFWRCHYLFRSSHSQKFFKIGVLKNFANLKENTCLFLINEHCNYIKKRDSGRRFPLKSEKLWRTPFLTEHLTQWLLLLVIVQPFLLLSVNLLIFFVMLQIWHQDMLLHV